MSKGIWAVTVTFETNIFILVHKLRINEPLVVVCDMTRTKENKRKAKLCKPKLRTPDRPAMPFKGLSSHSRESRGSSTLQLD